MAPNPLAQEAVLREAYRRAGVSPATFNTSRRMAPALCWATRVEARALDGCWPTGRAPENFFCAIGSVKRISVIAKRAGQASRADKVALALKPRRFRRAPALPGTHLIYLFDELPIRRANQAGSVVCRERSTRLAGVSSFGFGGHQCSCGLQQAPESRRKESRIGCG